MGRVKTKKATHPLLFKRAIKVPSHVTVMRHGVLGQGEPPFRACVRVGSSGSARREVGANLACASGKNPRKAVAAALRKLAGKVSTRAGAFAGYSKKRRR